MRVPTPQTLPHKPSPPTCGGGSSASPNPRCRAAPNGLRLWNPLRAPAPASAPAPSRPSRAGPHRPQPAPQGPGGGEAARAVPIRRHRRLEGGLELGGWAHGDGSGVAAGSQAPPPRGCPAGEPGAGPAGGAGGERRGLRGPGRRGGEMERNRAGNGGAEGSGARQAPEAAFSPRLPHPGSAPSSAEAAVCCSAPGRLGLKR